MPVPSRRPGKEDVSLGILRGYATVNDEVVARSGPLEILAVSQYPGAILRSDSRTEPMSNLPGSRKSVCALHHDAGERAGALAVGSTAMISMDRSSRTPIWIQLETGLRELITTGRLRPGARLPSTRALAPTLGVARNTLGAAYSELLAQGYLEAKIGSGTYVSRDLPERAMRAIRGPTREPQFGRPDFKPSRRGQLLAMHPVSHARQDAVAKPLRPGIPDYRAFPARLWDRAARSGLADVRLEVQLGHHDPAGYRPLRQAIAEHLAAMRALRVTADQVIVVPGAQFALNLLARVLADPGDLAVVEDPCRGGVHAALSGAGLSIRPAPVDEQGFPVTALLSQPIPRIVYLATSHHFPLGGLTSLSRRLQLLDFARKNGSWIIEDDYDGELKYSGRPVPSMQGLDNSDRVMYVGTFSRTLFPALRIGYIVATLGSVETLIAARATLDRFDAVGRQATLARFISDGHFDRHLRRMRRLYAARQEAFLGVLGSADDVVFVRRAAAGLHVVVSLPTRMTDTEFELRMARRGVEVVALSRYVTGPARPPAVVAGFAGYDEESLALAAHAIVDEVRRVVR